MKFSDDSVVLKAPLGLDYEFTFGKCKGQSIEDVIEIEPSYVIWCAENIDWFDLDTNVLDLAQDKIDEERRNDPYAGRNRGYTHDDFGYQREPEIGNRFGGIE